MLSKSLNFDDDEFVTGHDRNRIYSDQEKIFLAQKQRSDFDAVASTCAWCIS